MAYGTVTEYKYNVGDKIKVKIDGRVSGTTLTDANKLTTTKVFEEGGDGYGYYHNLFLLSPLVKVSDGGRVTAEFEATVSGDDKIGSLTRVTETADGGGANHFVYLNSPAVSPVGVSPVVKGTKLRVKIEGVTNGSGNINATTRVTEGEYTHLLYTGSMLVKGTSGAIIDSSGETVTTDMDVTVTGAVGQGPDGTTTVKEFLEDGRGYTHYIRVDSPSVTVVVPEPKIESAGLIGPDGPSATVTADDLRRIPVDAIEIGSGAVIARIGELRPRYVIRRVFARAGQELEIGRFENKAAAEEFINFNDYNPERVVVDKDALEEEDAIELKRLLELDRAGRSVFGLQWGSSTGVFLFAQGFFNEAWAREQASGDLGVSLDDTYNWPLDRVDWEEAARVRRDLDNTYVYYGGNPYYGANV